MKKLYYAPLLVVVVLSMALSGCLQKASTAPTAIVTVTLAAPWPAVTKPPIKEVFSATQTALAQTTGQPKSLATETLGAPPELTKTTPIVAATATATIFPTATPGHPTTYVLQEGEWPICIARRYNLDLDSFFSANGLNMNSKPAAGTPLKLPASGTWNDGYGTRYLHAHTAGATYTVVAGDTLQSIACYYGDVDPNAIVAANGLKSPYALSAGTKLVIP